MTKPYTVRLEDEDGPEVERMAKNLDRSVSYVIKFLVHAALEQKKVKSILSLENGNTINTLVKDEI